MNRQKVESSQIASVGYDAEAKVLEIEFLRGGSVYQYFAVPQEVYDGMMAAESVGSFFFKNVKGVFEYKKQDAAAVTVAQEG